MSSEKGSLVDVEEQLQNLKKKVSPISDVALHHIEDFEKQFQQFRATLKQQIKEKSEEEFERAKFTAYSDIRVDKKSLHGNVNTVVNLSEAKAIVNNLLEELLKEK